MKLSGKGDRVGGKLWRVESQDSHRRGTISQVQDRVVLEALL